jgi:hypothetical protein
MWEEEYDENTFETEKRKDTRKPMKQGWHAV